MHIFEHAYEEEIVLWIRMVVTNISGKIQFSVDFFFNQIKHTTKDLFEFIAESNFIFNIFHERNKPPETI